MEDILHQPVRSRLMPGLNEVIRDARKAGAFGAALLVIKQKTTIALVIGIMLLAHTVDSLSSVEPVATQLLAWCGLGALLARERLETTA